jgi:hypothetical protein
MICPCNKETIIKKVFGINFYIHKEDKERCKYLNASLELGDLVEKVYKVSLNNNDEEMLIFSFIHDKDMQYIIASQFQDIDNIEELKEMFNKYRCFLHDMENTMVKMYGESFLDNCVHLGIRGVNTNKSKYSSLDAKFKMINIKKERIKEALENSRKKLKDEISKKIRINTDALKVDETTLFKFYKNDGDKEGYFVDESGNIIKENEFNALFDMIENGQMDGEAFKHIIRNVSGMKIAKSEYDNNKLCEPNFLSERAESRYESSMTDTSYGILLELQRKYSMQKENLKNIISEPVSKVEGGKKKDQKDQEVVVTWATSDDPTWESSEIPIIDVINNLKNSMLNVGLNVKQEYEKPDYLDTKEKLNEMKKLQKEKTRKFVEALHKYNRRK